MSQEAISLPKGIELGVFRPVAYFDKHMDCIRVLTHDCSVTEHRINEFYTLYEANYPGQFDPKYVGFTIKGITSLFNEVGIPFDRSYKLADLIGRLVKHRPGSVMSETLSLIFSQHSTTGDLNIDMAEAA